MDIFKVIKCDGKDCGNDVFVWKFPDRVEIKRNCVELSANSFFCDRCKTSEKVYMLHKKPACGKSYPHFPQYIHRFIHNETSEK